MPEVLIDLEQTLYDEFTILAELGMGVKEGEPNLNAEELIMFVVTRYANHKGLARMDNEWKALSKEDKEKGLEKTKEEVI